MKMMIETNWLFENVIFILLYFRPGSFVRILENTTFLKRALEYN